MKYFELKLDNVNFTGAPRLINWYGVQDVRLIKWESYHKWKNRQVYSIDPSPHTIFTDIVSSPFLLVSPMVKDTIRMYADEVVFKEVILLDSVNEFDKVYYLPIMRENNEIEFQFREKNDRHLNQKGTPEWIKERNIFWITNKGTRHTIINLDLAESLLRRQAMGIQLKEVQFNT